MKRAIIIAAVAIFLVSTIWSGAQMFAQLFGATGTPIPAVEWTPAELAPVAWWKGEDNATDSVGANNGTWTGTPAYADGKVGRAFSFVAGTSKIVRATPYATAIDRSVGFSIAAWIQMDGNFQDYGEIMFTVGDVQHIGLASTKNESAFASFRDASNTIRRCSPVAFEAGQWKHVAIVLDSTAGRCYINGALSSSTTAHTTPYTLDGSAFYIGGYRSISLGNNNRVDDVLIFNRALTAPEIKLLYDETVKRNGRAW